MICSLQTVLFLCTMAAAVKFKLDFDFGNLNYKFTYSTETVTPSKPVAPFRLMQAQILDALKHILPGVQQAPVTTTTETTINPGAEILRHLVQVANTQTTSEANTERTESNRKNKPLEDTPKTTESDDDAEVIYIDTEVDEEESTTVTKHHKTSTKRHRHKNKEDSDKGSKKHRHGKKNATEKATTNATTVALDISPHKIKHDTHISNFTKNILRSGLDIFKKLKERSNNYIMKEKLDDLAGIYEDKYKDFLRSTSQLKIKTRLGSKKVILNSIDMSYRILKRMVNYVVAELDQEGSLRENLVTANNFQQEVAQISNQEFKHACNDFGICRSVNGFSHFLTEIMTTILQLDDDKFKLAIDSLTEVTKNMDFSDVFEKKTRRNIKKMVERVERRRLDTIRPTFMIIKNIIANQNKPLVVGKGESKNCQINATLGILEIVDALEDSLPRNDDNIIEWGDLRTNMSDWAEGSRTDIVDIMGSFMSYIKTGFKSMPVADTNKVQENFARVVHNSYN